MSNLVWLIPAFPLIGFTLLVLLGRRLGEPNAGWLATTMVTGSFLSTLGVFIGMAGKPSEERDYEIT